MGIVVSNWMLRFCARLGLCFLSGRAAYGQGVPQTVVDCVLLDAERSAEVEARVRATLLTAQVPETRVTITCTRVGAQVEAASGARVARVPVSAEAPELQARLLDAVDRALAELSELEPSEQVASEVPAEPVVEPPPPRPAAPPPAAPPPPPHTASLSPRQRPTVLEAGALGLVEAWSESVAVGGQAALGYGGAAFRAGLVAGVTTVTAGDTAFRVQEWNAAVELSWQPPWSYGLRAGVGVGASLLAVSPRADFTPRQGTTAGAWFAELSCSRPVWIAKHWAIMPRLTARIFGADRTVNVNDAEALALAGIVPSFGLGVLYRFE